MIAWLIAAVGAIVAAICSAADAALLGSVEPAAPAGEGSTLPHGDRRDLTHRALSIVRVAAYLLAGVAAAVALDLGDRPAALSLVLALLIAAVVVVAFEELPRAIGDVLGAPLLRALAPVIAAAEVAARPLAAIGGAIDQALQRALPTQRSRDGDRDATAEQFRQVVQAEGDVPRDHSAILHRVFSLGDTEVQEVMVPRVDIIGVERSTPWSEVLDRVRSSQHARLPVYEETLDRIVGILFAKDLLSAVLDDEEPEAGWTSLIRPAAFIPESKAIDAQLRDFKASRSHIAIVVDEYGGTAGLITIEDIIEEIVGDIRDEYDVEEQAVEREGDTRFWVSGRLTLEGFRVVVERVVRRRIDRVYFERIEEMAERRT